MSSLSDFLSLLVAVPVVLAIVAIHAAPQLLAGWAAERRDEARRRAAQEAELDRKIAIGQAAIAARSRGESFTPPADYDR